MALRPCLRCGALAHGSYCALHQPQRGSAAWRDGSTRAWRQICAQALQRDGHRCTHCGRTEDLEVHHVNPRANGGRDELHNLATLCRYHHGDRHRRT